MNNDQLNTPVSPVTEEIKKETKPAINLKYFTSWKSEKLMSFTAFLISIGTFITFAYQTHLIQKQQFRSVLPYLMITNYTGYINQDQKTISLQLLNNGIGPAFVEDLTISYKGKEYKSVYDFFIQGIYPDHKISVGRNDIIAGYSIPAGQALPLLTSNDSQATTVLEKVFTSDGFSFEIVYSSLYEENWRLSYKNGRYNPKPEKVD
jgi:hypothetical protein